MKAEKRTPPAATDGAQNSTHRVHDRLHVLEYSGASSVNKPINQKSHDGAESALVAPLSSRRPGRPKWGTRVARRAGRLPQNCSDPVRAIMDLGGTLVIGSKRNTRYFLPPDWPYHA